MKKLLLKCRRECDIDDCRESVYLHGWLMNHLDDDFASELHQAGMNPMSIQVVHDEESVSFIINLLTEKACNEVEPLIMSDSLNMIRINSGNQHEFEIIEKSVFERSESDLSKIFYGNDCSKVLKLKIMTPTAFKTNGKYVFLPDVRLVFQNLMKKYGCAFEKGEDIDFELLDEICIKVEVAAFSLKSRRFYLHKAYVNGFQGYLTLVCHGSQTLTNYIAMLLKFAEYSGIGVKTSMGMGAVRILEGVDNVGKKNE
ncbi:CRISPR-associated endoribonuclease Cas6 [Ligilactobacillus ruminis]|uniref:CRISPR-associated endoribonuclease Cas6 n=2 Tax=Ligilactobacillus ruminis TaxID=1623 RepID=A0A1I2PPZ5_9LACO|nr:CRISPR-associated endoribonuclease Cas6 [Ligilactobacillus ruminis]SFG15501.1 CRISPR-associated endoribonuclease Cas6 [Ligilactobacillus ruminis DSM 20403 = NBRC 102161]